MNYLIESKDTETVLKCTRYFGLVMDERAKETIAANLNHTSWSIRAVSALSIEPYVNSSAIQDLKISLSDNNYFVRKNSAFTLMKY